MSIGHMGEKVKGQSGRLLGLILLVWAASILPALAADPVNRMLTLQVDDQSATPTVLIQTQEPVGYRYTVYDSIDPVRVVVDFPGMELGDVAEILPVERGPILEIRAGKFDLASGRLARLEVLLKQNAEYQVSLDGKDFRIAFPDIAATAPTAAQDAPPVDEPPSTAPQVAVAEAAVPVETVAAADEQLASVLRAINLSSGKAVVEANGPVGHFQYFTLGNPPRLVVDMYGVRPGFKSRSFAADAGFKQVRVGTYNEKTRLVFDAEGPSVPQHLVQKQGNDLLVNWGDVAVSPVTESTPAEPAPAMAAAVPKPPVVATKTMVTEGPSVVEAIDFINEDGRSVVAVRLTAPVESVAPVYEAGMVRFELKNIELPRALRRSIDASAFPSAVSNITPYTVADGKQQNLRISVALKGPVAYVLEEDGNQVRLVLDDGAYAEAPAPEVTTLKVQAPLPAAGSGATVAQTAIASPDAGQVQMPGAESSQYSGQKISLVFDDADIRSILQLIGEVSEQNLLASSDVKGTITLRLIDVPWDQALDLIMETAELGKIQEGNVLRIMPVKKIRERELSAMQAMKEDLDEGILETRSFEISYASVKDMAKFLEDVKSPRGTLISDTRSKQIIAKDVASVLEQMAELISRVDKPERQVMIEARIVEASTNFARDLGVKWAFDYNDASNPVNKNWDLNEAQVGMGGNFFIPLPAGGLSAAGGTAGMVFGALDGNLNIDLRISALESSGDGKIVSTPRVTTLNGQKAVISQGTKIPYTVTSDQGTDTKFENAELKLEVTPEINPDGSVILDIKAANSAVGAVVPTGDGTAISIDEKKAETIVLVHDGQTTVLGGIFVEDERESETGVPLLKDIPILGHLFKSTSKSGSRKELLIFITPRIIE